MSDVLRQPAEQQFEVQTSTDLENWSVAPGGPVAAENSADETSATVSVPAGGAYVRVRRL